MQPVGIWQRIIIVTIFLPTAPALSKGATEWGSTTQYFFGHSHNATVEEINHSGAASANFLKYKVDFDRPAISFAIIFGTYNEMKQRNRSSCTSIPINQIGIFLVLLATKKVQETGGSCSPPDILCTLIRPSARPESFMSQSILTTRAV